MPKKVIVIGAGFSGLSAAAFLAKAGWEVTVLEKQATAGGRARQLSAEGFHFDMGPSWYWMPDVFDRFFAQFGKQTSAYYNLQRLDPSYRVYWKDGATDIPANLEQLQQLFESIEPGSALQLAAFLKEAAYKYKVGVQRLVYKPGQSLTELLDIDLLKGIFRLDVFTSMKKHVRKYFRHPKLIQLLEFPVLFLGALPAQTPALYSLMNYADIVGGTWFPEGGMYSIVKAMVDLATELGVQFQFNEDVEKIEWNGKIATAVITQHKSWQTDAVIGSADYHFIETRLLPAQARSYSDAYWQKRMMAPSCILYYIGLNKKLTNILHHSLFFDTDFDKHAAEIYTSRQWPQEPMFYACTASKTDTTLAPEGGENLFLLIPVAAGLEGDTAILREMYFNKIIARLEQHTGESVGDAIVYKKCIAQTELKEWYNAFKGNAYGLANTLLQTAHLKPGIRSKKVKNLFYAGQLTVPGPGVPPSLISGEIAAQELIRSWTH